MNRQRIAILLSSLLGVASTFLPWTKIYLAGGEGVHRIDNGLKAGGVTILILFLIPLVLSLFRDRSKPMPMWMTICSAFPAFYAGITALWRIIRMGQGYMNVANVDAGVGLWLSMIAGFAVGILAFALAGKSTGQKNRS